MLTRNTDILRQEVAEHIAADAVVQGHYWTGDSGCFIGCLTHSDDPLPAVERFGFTLPILRIAENIFESLNKDDAKAFFAALPDAVGQNGKDLSRVHWQFLAEELRALPKAPKEVQAAIDPVIAGMDLLAGGQKWSAARAAARAARAASHAVSDAAHAAAHAAADAAADAAARAAADAAADAAYASDATRAPRAAVKRQRDTLLRLISDAPVVEAAT